MNSLAQQIFHVHLLSHIFLTFKKKRAAKKKVKHWVFEFRKLSANSYFT